MLPVDLVIVFTILLIVFIVMTTVYGFVAGVPYVPTPVYVARAMVDLARLRGTETVVDIGAGNGRVLIEAKRKHPSIDATGIELAPTVWLLGIVNIFLSGMRIRFVRGNALVHDMSGADAIFLYLSPSLMATLEDKFDRELRPGTVVISHAFSFPRRQPTAMTALPGWIGKKTIRRYEW